MDTKIPRSNNTDQLIVDSIETVESTKLLAAFSDDFMIEQ